MNTYTVVFTYTLPYTPETAGVRGRAQRQPPGLFYDCTEARTASLAVALLTPKCPGLVTDVLVFEGELYDLQDLVAEARANLADADARESFAEGRTEQEK